MCLKVSSAKWRPFCPVEEELKDGVFVFHDYVFINVVLEQHSFSSGNSFHSTYPMEIEFIAISGWVEPVL